MSTVYFTTIKNAISAAAAAHAATAAEFAALAETYLAGFGTLVDGTYTYRTKAQLTADFANIPANAFARVLVDESKNDTLSVYQKVGGVLEYLFSLGNMTNESPVATGVLFDTDGTDNFTDLIYTPDAALTVTDGSAAFSSSTAMDLILNIPALNGTDTFYHCFDDWTIDATFTVTSWPAAGVTGVHVGPRSLAPGPSDEQYGMQIAAHGGTATSTMIAAITANAAIEYTHTQAGLPKTFRVRYHHSLTNNLITHTVNVDGGADIQLTQPYTTGSFRPPSRKMSVPIRFKRGVLTCTKLKFSAGNPNTRFAFVGDSLTVGTGATTLTEGFAHLVRAEYPGEVLIAGASGSTTEDWLGMVESVVRMKPRYAFVCLGTNDRSSGWTVARSQAAMTTIINALVAADIVPIVLASPPMGHVNASVFNTWLAAQGWRYVDIYTTLLGTGSSLATAYNSGDGIHWNSAGHLAVKNQIAAYITAQGLV